VSAWEWHTALEQECQPLDRRSPNARVLCGLPKPDMRQRLGRPFLEGLLGRLRREVRYVVVDTGADLLGVDSAFHRAVVSLADQVLVVAATDVVGLWQARQSLALLRDTLHVDANRFALVLNRFDARFHHSRTEIEWTLATPTAAVVPYDHAAIQRSIAAQRPVVLDETSRAGRSLLDLAGRIHGGKLVLPPEPDAPPKRGLQAFVDRLSSAVRVRGERNANVA
jgi:Flp pilus assembly CpaE family ATPase